MQDSPFEILLTGPTGPVLAALWGALWGSFLNVVIERLPRGGSVLRPPSHCLSCQAPIRFYDNIPLVSYLVLWGRCRACGTRFSPRYFLVEALGLVLALLCFHNAVTLGIESPPVRLASFLVAFFFCLGLLAILFIDIRTMIIPDAISLPMLIVLGSAAVAIGRVTWVDATLGAALGFGLVYTVRALWFLWKGQEGIGLGDAKLLAVVGGVLGWQALPPVLLLASVQGIVVALPLRLAGYSLVATQSYQGTSVRPAESPLDDGSPSGIVETASGPGAEESPAPGAETSPASGVEESPASCAETSPASCAETSPTPGAETSPASCAETSPAPGVEESPAPGEEEGSEDEEYDEVPAGAVPFGPFLALAAMEWLLWGAFLSERLSGILDVLVGGVL